MCLICFSKGYYNTYSDVHKIFRAWASRQLRRTRFDFGWTTDTPESQENIMVQTPSAALRNLQQHFKPSDQKKKHASNKSELISLYN